MFRNFQKMFEISPNPNGKLTKSTSYLTTRLLPNSMKMSSYANIMKVTVVGGAGKKMNTVNNKEGIFYICRKNWTTIVFNA